MTRLIAMIAALILATAASGGESRWRQDIDRLVKAGRGSAEGRAAWERLSGAGPDALLPLLDAMDTTDTVRANWLRTAFDRIVEREQAQGGKRIDADALLRYVRDARKQGRARRLALDVVTSLRPGTRDKLIASWLEDPEFRYDAVERVLHDASASLKRKRLADARQQLRTAFDAARDQQQ